jgi:ribonuclease HI
MDIEIYTDGACKGGAGGWGLCVQKNGQVDAYYDRRGHEKHTDQGGMEMTAVLEALKVAITLMDDPEINTGVVTMTINTTSDLSYHGSNDGADGWTSKGLKKKSEPLLNKELWQQIEKYIGMFKMLHASTPIQVKWITPNTTIFANERAVRLARVGAAYL